MQVITADLVLAGPDLAPVERAAVLVDGDRIAWVGRSADLSPDRYPADTPVLALGPVTVLPGLIDCHVHLAFDGGPAPVARMRAEDDARQVALMTRNARRLLSVGVTTARDLGGRGYLGVSVRDAIADGTLRGPRLLTAGPPLTVTGGHCWFTAGLSADLIAVGGDPRHDLAVLHDLRLVLARGEPFSPDPLPPIPPLRREDLPGFAFTAPGADAPPPPEAQTA
jgi:imidazolonepropionase-like amidohydrolase